MIYFRMAIDDLRAEADRLRRNVTRKISRIRRNTGAEISGTVFDVRRTPHAQDRYNQASLRNYIREMQQFLSRANQFVSGSYEKPIRRSEWQRYQSLEAQYNRHVSEKFERVKNIELPNGMTIGERAEMITPLHRQMHNPSVNQPYDPPVRKSTSIEGMKALEKLINAMLGRAEESYDSDQVRKGREQFSAMAERLGDAELVEKVKNLSEEQFEILWFHSDFANDISLNYNWIEMMMQGRDQPFVKDMANNAARDYRTLVNWAANL